jgi:hypothetical protein
MKKLSELMREGAQNTFQAFDDFFDWTQRPLIGCCALGSALYAIGETNPYSIESLESKLHDATGIDITTQIATHPETNAGLMTLYDIITSLNDDSKWTREDIATWLENNGL